MLLIETRIDRIPFGPISCSILSGGIVSTKSKIRDLFLRTLNRRRVMKDGMGVFAASFIGLPMLSSLLTIRQTGGEEDAAKKSAPTKITGAKKKTIDPLFAPFLNDKLTYEVSFMGMMKAAEVKVSLRQGLGEEIIGELEAKVLGVVKLASQTKKQVFKSRLVVRPFEGTKRLIATNFSRLSEKSGTVTKTLHRFNWEKKTWDFRKYVNGKRKEVESKTIPADVTYYEDFVGFLYNIRAGTYGEMTPGKTIPVRTIPFKGVDKYTLHIGTEEQLKGESDWLEKNPGSKYLGIIEIHQNIFGLKTGEGRILADEKLVPLAGRIKDVMGFGDVEMKLTKRGK
jgi:hypothetical protein